MPLLIATYLLQIACAVHAFRRGAPYPVIFLIIAFPVIGCVIYVVAVILPDLQNSRGAHQAAEAIKDNLAPNRHLRRAADNLEIADTVENRLRLADELSDKERYGEAVPIYRGCLEGPFADNPDILFRLAAAQFEGGDPAGAVATLDELAAANPDYRSEDAHLLYARAHEASGNNDAALREYESVSTYYAGPEAKCRHALLLQAMGRAGEARQLYGEVLRGAKHAPPHVRKRHRDWIDLAQREA